MTSGLTLGCLTALLTFPPQAPPERHAFRNQSTATWRVTLVEGRKPRVGRMVFIDTFTGRERKALERTRDSVVVPPGASFMYALTWVKGYCYQEFIVQDAQGQYGQYCATVPYLGNPQVVTERRGHGLKPSPALASERAAARVVEAAVRLDRGDFTIVRNGFGPAR